MFKPMLACNADLTKLRFPVLASPKFDGIRCVVLNGKALSRNLKPIPNDYTRAWLEAHCDGLDGELVVGDPTAKDCFQRTTSAVMSKAGEPEVAFYAFDVVDRPELDFESRLVVLATRAGFLDAYQCVPHTWIRDAVALERYEARRVAEGWEGVMLRDPAGLYKHGRSTVREGGLLKVKRFADAEAVIVGFVERQHNANEASVDALGHTERSTHKANLKPLGDLGALVVELEVQLPKGFAHVAGPPARAFRRFNIGSGFTAAQRADFWARRESLLGATVCFKYQAVGTDEAPRFPVFKGFRPEGA
jgi:DNA ligase-1